MFLPIALLSIATVTPITPAPSGAPRAIVHTEDLDLRSSCGAAELHRRLDQAVVAMSGGEAPATGTMLRDRDLDAARRTARQQADAMIAAAKANATGTASLAMGGRRSQPIIAAASQ